jgi:hypothetical protein
MKRFKILSAAVALVAVLGMAGVAGAKGAKANAKQKGVHGKITAIVGNDQITVSTGGKKNAQTYTIKTDGLTLTDKSGQTIQFSALHANDRVILEPDANNPTKIVDQGQGKGHAKKKAK